MLALHTSMLGLTVAGHTSAFGMPAVVMGPLKLGAVSARLAQIIMADEEELPALRKPELTAAEMSAEMAEVTGDSSQARRLQPKSPLWRKAPPGRDEIDEERGWGDRKPRQ